MKNDYAFPFVGLGQAFAPVTAGAPSAVRSAVGFVPAPANVVPWVEKNPPVQVWPGRHAVQVSLNVPLSPWPAAWTQTGLTPTMFSRATPGWTQWAPTGDIFRFDTIPKGLAGIVGVGQSHSGGSSNVPTPPAPVSSAIRLYAGPTYDGLHAPRS